MKLATITNFTNIEEKSNTYFLENMSARRVAGQSVLSTIFANSNLISEDTSGYSDLGLTLAGSSLVLNQGSIVLLNTAGNIHEYNVNNSTNSIGKIHSSYGTYPSIWGDLKVTKNENILFSGDDYLGIGYLGTATGGSTTRLTDTTTDFTALGVSSSDGLNKAYNFTKKVEYTITSVSSQYNLNFATSTATAANDKYAVFLDKGKYNSGNYWNFFATTAYPHFEGQEVKTNFKRQIVIFDTDYLIGNGNFLAALNVDESTWNDNFKQLPDSTQFECMAVNQDKILIGASRRGKGVLLLWDGFTNGFLAIEELEQIPKCICAYSGGWLIVVGNSVYYSNGYQSKKITTLPDIPEVLSSTKAFFNSGLVINDKFILNLQLDGYNRNRSGIWIYEFGSGWTFTPQTNGSDVIRGQSYGGIISVSEYPTNLDNRYILTGVSGGDGTKTNLLNNLVDTGALKGSAMFFVNFGRKVNISEIRLNISPRFMSSALGTTATISVAIGDGRKPNFRTITAGSSSTTSNIVNAAGASAPAEIGGQVYLANLNAGGERSYVQTVSNAGTSSEQFTISPAFSATSANGFIIMNHLKLTDTKTLNTTLYQDDMPFIVEGFFSDKCYLEVYWTSAGGKFDINSIDIYGS